MCHCLGTIGCDTKPQGTVPWGIPQPAISRFHIRKRSRNGTLRRAACVLTDGGQRKFDVERRLVDDPLNE